MPEVITHPSNRAIFLRNRTCVYCGRVFEGDLLPTREHVIGRRFVPRGCFGGQWNLIVNACEKCNADKSGLEDDISAISMLPDLMGRFAIDDIRLVEEVNRKASRSHSRRTGKTVAKSHEQINLEQTFGSTTFAFNFGGPPQVDEARIFNLAYYHFCGFFYLTFQQATHRGGFVRGEFCPLAIARWPDWGNPHFRWFMDTVRDWKLRIHAVGADGFFKMIIRRQPEDQEVWAWALEWNHGTRVVGFAGDPGAMEDLAASIPDLGFKIAHQNQNSWTRMRMEISLGRVD